MGPKPREFWSVVSKAGNGGCWIWTASRSKNGGYGVFRRNGVLYRAHRHSFQLKHGPIPKGLSVLHRCDTPACVNPSHLFLGTQGDNMRDMAKKGRAGKVLTQKQAHTIRALVEDGQTQKVVAKQFGVSLSTVSNISRGIWWR